MNKIIISTVLVAAICVGVASANLRKHKHLEEENCCLELQHQHHHHRPHHRPHHNHHDFEGDDFEAEFGHGGGGLGHGGGGLGHGGGGLGHGGGGLGHGGGSGLGHGGGGGGGLGHGQEFGHGGQGGQGGHGIRHRRPKFNKGKPHQGRHGQVHHKQRKNHPLGGGAGAAGGIRGQEAHLNGLHSSSHLGSSDSIEGHKASFKNGQAGFEFDQHRGDHDELEGIRKHQLVSRDKTIIKDKTTGVNDVDGFRHSESHNEDNHLGANIAGGSGSEVGGSIRKDRDFDHDLDLVNGGESSGEAFGAKGAGVSL